MCPGEAERAGAGSGARLDRPPPGPAHRGALQRGHRADRHLLHPRHRHQEVRGRGQGRHQENRCDTFVTRMCCFRFVKCGPHQQLAAEE